MLSNQSVSGHPSPAPTAHGVLPASLYCSVSWSSCYHVSGGWAPSSWSEFGLYQMTLFEFAFATTP